MLSRSGRFMQAEGKTCVIKRRRLRSGRYAWRVVDECPEKMEVPGKLQIGAGGKVLAKGAKVQINWGEGAGSKVFDAHPWRVEELEEVSGLLQGGVPKLYCDASVRGDCKAVAMWLGTEEKGGEDFCQGGGRTPARLWERGVRRTGAAIDGAGVATNSRKEGLQSGDKAG